MNASAILRKLKDLDILEKRVKQTVAPSKKLLTQIDEERNKLLSGNEETKK